MNEREMQEELLESREINLLDLWVLVLKRKWLIAAVAATVFVLAAVYVFTRTPVYTATGQLLIEKEPNILTFEEIFQVESFQTSYYETQYKLLQSRSLAERAAERLKLSERPEFAGNGKKPAPAKSDPAARGRLIDAFLGGLSVDPVAQTRLVNVSFKSADPKLAADAVNALFDSFIDMSVESRYTATEQATEFLTQQIASLRSDIERKEKELQAYAGEKNIVALSDTETTVVSKLAELNTALTQAQIDRVNKEAFYNEVRNATPNYIPASINNPIIQNLRQEYARLNREYSRKQEQFGPEYPEIQRLKTDLESTRKSLETETRNLINAAHADFQAARKKEMSLQGVFNEQKQESIQLNSNAISYNTLRNEILNNKSLLDTLVKRQSETGVSARLRGVGVSNIRIVDRAETPQAPSSPKKKRTLLLALLAGLFGGFGLAYLLDRLDNSIKSAQDVEKTAGLPTLGVIAEFDPEAKKKGYGYGYGYGSGRHGGGITFVLKNNSSKKDSGGRADAKGEKTAAGPKDPPLPAVKTIDLIAHASPKSNISESYRSIRTAILLSTANPGHKIFTVSSALPSEGKSATAANLAVTLAQTGKRVLLLDADLRKPRLHRIFKLKNQNGLTNYLTGTGDVKELVKVTVVPDLYLINSGPLPPNPAELLGSDKMAGFVGELKAAFDYILVDTPPVLAVTDALVLGRLVDGLILVAWGGKTSREALKRAVEKLRQTGTKTPGVIINRLDVKAHDYYYRHHYYYDYYEHPGES